MDILPCRNLVGRQLRAGGIHLRPLLGHFLLAIEAGTGPLRHQAQRVLLGGQVGAGDGDLLLVGAQIDVKPRYFALQRNLNRPTIVLLRLDAGLGRFDAAEQAAGRIDFPLHIETGLDDVDDIVAKITAGGRIHHAAGTGDEIVATLTDIGAAVQAGQAGGDGALALGASHENALGGLLDVKIEGGSLLDQAVQGRIAEHAPPGIGRRDVVMIGRPAVFAWRLDLRQPVVRPHHAARQQRAQQHDAQSQPHFAGLPAGAGVCPVLSAS